jgi:hypothetical protein
MSQTNYRKAPKMPPEWPIFGRYPERPKLKILNFIKRFSKRYRYRISPAILAGFQGETYRR